MSRGRWRVRGWCRWGDQAVSEPEKQPLDYRPPENEPSDEERRGCMFIAAAVLIGTVGIGVGLILMLTVILMSTEPAYRWAVWTLVGGALAIVAACVFLRLKFRMSGLLAAAICSFAVGGLLFGVCAVRPL